MDVKTAQTTLLNHGYWLSGSTGKTDLTTTQALYAFQKVNGLKRSGIIDEATSKVLERAARPSTSVIADGIEIDKARQVMFVVRGGSILWIFNTSTGSGIPYTENGVSGSAQTPNGDFSILREVNGVDDGPLGDLYRPKYFTWSGIAIHGAASVPPYPASHGCARVSNPAIDFIWSQNLAPKGSRVLVH